MQSESRHPQPVEGQSAPTEVIGGRVRSLGHEEAGEEPTRAFLKKLSLGGEVEEGVVAVVVDHLKPSVLHDEVEKGRLEEKAYANAVRRLLKRIAPVSWKVLVGVSEVDARGRTLPGAQTNPYRPGELMARVVGEFGLDKAPTTPLIQGRDVLALIASRGETRKPGVWVGEAIKAIEAMRDEGKIATREEALEALRSLDM